MRGVLFKDMLIRARRRAVILDLCDLGDVDLRGKALAVILVGQPARHLGERGVAQPERAIGKSEFHSFSNDVRGVRRADGALGFEDVQNLRDVHAAGAGRRHADDPAAVVSALNRLATLERIRGEVCLSDEAAVLTHPLGRGLGERATIEPIRSAGSERTQGLRKFGLLMDLAFLERRSVGMQEDRAG